MNNNKKKMIEHDLKITSIILARIISVLVIVGGIYYALTPFHAIEGIVVAVTGVLMVSYVPDFPPEPNFHPGRIRLFLDDERLPFDSDWVVVRNFDEFKVAINKWFEHIEVISFDHDLGSDEYNGMTCLRYLSDYFMDHPHLISPLNEIYAHSANPVGVKNITEFANQMRKHIHALHDLEIHDYSVTTTKGFAHMPEGFIRKEELKHG
jgi:hypothetical protein